MPAACKRVLQQDDHPTIHARFGHFSSIYDASIIVAHR